jgi:hypothetical protein
MVINLQWDGWKVLGSGIIRHYDAGYGVQDIEEVPKRVIDKVKELDQSHLEKLCKAIREAVINNQCDQLAKKVALLNSEHENAIKRHKAKYPVLFKE